MSDILEPNGRTSSVRVGMLFCVGTACIISIVVTLGSVLLEKPIDSNVPWLVGGLLSAGFGGKVIQKKAEQ